MPWTSLMISCGLNLSFSDGVGPSLFPFSYSGFALAVIGAFYIHC